MTVSLAEAVDRAVLGAMDPARMSLRGVMLALRGIAGTVTEAARLAGMDRRTWQRWESGKVHTPTPSKVDTMRAALRRARADEQRPSLTAARGRLVIKGTIGISNDVREGRKLDLSSYFSTGTRESIVDAVAAGDSAEAAERFEIGLSTDYEAPGMYVQDVDYLDWR